MRQHFTPHWCRVSVDLGRSKSLICTWVESLTSPTVIIQGKSAFLHTEQVRSSILIKCLPPYIVKWIGLLMSEYYNRHNRLASTCPLSNLSPVFGPSIKRKLRAITQQREKRLLISYLALKLGYIYKTHAHIHKV